MRKLRFGILSTARIALLRVIPAMQQASLVEVDAIASRDLKKAKKAGEELQIPIVHASYDDLLADDRIDAVYNPLPNHLHVDWSIKALESGKHVLCEKPIGLDAGDAARLIDASRNHPRLRIMEAFMYRFHPQWQRAREIVQGGGLGKVSRIHTDFSFRITHSDNIRLQAEMGGGALMDIGCYGISAPRFLFGAEPGKARGTMRLNDQGVDLDCNGELDFGEGRTAAFHASIDGDRKQGVRVEGDRAVMEIPSPFGMDAGQSAKLMVVFRESGKLEEIILPWADHFTRQADAFARAVLYDESVPTPLTDAWNNMRAIDAVKAAVESSGWVNLN